MNGSMENVAPRARAVSGSRLERMVRELFERADVQIGGHRPWDIQVRDDRFYGELIARRSLGLGESYMAEWWDVRHLDQMIHRILQVDMDQARGKDWREVLAAVRARLFNLQSASRANLIAKAHYDLGNALFEEMLGCTLAYSCAYWAQAETLDGAQTAKFELICRKLGLSRGQRVLDIGCGWGGFAKHAAEKYGCEVVGITVSAPQRDRARQVCAGLPVQILLEDYRSEAVQKSGPFDRIVSVGMFEHVGRKNYRRFMELCRQLLTDEGSLLLHTIGNVSSEPPESWTVKYIFPNGELPAPAEISRAFEGLFVMEDWHSFGADYDRTLMAWHENFERAVASGRHRCERQFYRMWKYYLLSFAGCFRVRDRMQLWQLVLSKRGTPGGYRSVR